MLYPSAIHLVDVELDVVEVLADVVDVDDGDGDGQLGGVAPLPTRQGTPADPPHPTSRHKHHKLLVAVAILGRRAESENAADRKIEEPPPPPKPGGP